MDTAQGILGGLSALAIGSVAWAYNTLVRHNEQIAVLIAGQSDIKAGIDRVERKVDKQTETCQQVLLTGGHAHRRSGDDR